MKRLARLALVGWLGLQGMVFADSVAPVGSGSSVTLDWQKFNEFWARMQEMEKKITELEKPDPDTAPPVGFTLAKAAYKGSVQKQIVRMSGLMEIEVYEPKEWVKVPFMPSAVAISEVRLDGKPVGIVEDNGFHTLLLRKPGRHSLAVQFTLPAPKQEESPQLQFQFPSTPITYLSLEFPRPNLDVQIEPSQGVTQQTADGKTLITAVLPPSTDVTVRWQKAVTEEVSGPAKLYLDAQTLLSVGDGTVKALSNLTYTILRRGVRQLRVQIPADWNVLAVTSEGLQEWKREETPKGAFILAEYSYARRGAVTLAIHMERALAENESVVEAPRLRALDIEREQGTVGVEAKGSVELSVQSTDGLQAIDPRELPGGLWQSAGQPILFGFRYTKPYTLALDVKRHTEIPVLTTTIDEANAITVQTERGQWITKVRYQVRNQLKQSLTFHLPKGAQLWSAFVAGEPVKPMQSGEGLFRIPLAKSQMGGTGQTGFPVELIYYQQQPKFHPLGYRSYAFPVPDAPISRMMWSLYLPDNYRFPWFGGDVEKEMMTTTLLQSVAPVSTVYKKRNEFEGEKNENLLRQLASKIVNGGRARKSNARDEEVSQLADAQAQLAKGLFDSPAVPMQAGVMPVAFALPAQGQLFHFGQIMVIDREPVVSFLYLHQAWITFVWLLLIGCLVYGLSRQRNILLAFGRRLQNVVVSVQWRKMLTRSNP